MSWFIRRVGQDRAALKAAIRKESSLPKDIAEEICKRMDELVSTVPGVEHLATYVETSGHLEMNAKRPWVGTSDIRIHVTVIPFIK